ESSDGGAGDSASDDSSDSAGGASSETSEGDSATESGSSDSGDESVVEEEAGAESGSSAYEVDEEKVSLVEEATETDQSIADVLQDPSEVSSYVHESSTIVEVTQGEEPLDQQFVGIVAEVDESDGLEIAADRYNENLEVTQPYGYGNSETGEVLIYEQESWQDASSQYSPEELVYGTY